LDIRRRSEVHGIADNRTADKTTKRLAQHVLITMQRILALCATSGYQLPHIRSYDKQL